MSGIPTTAEKKSTYTEHFPCRIPVWRILQPFPHFCETHNTHSQLPLGLPPVRRPPFLSCTSPLCPAEGIPGLRPEGLSQKFPLKQAPIIACGVSGGLGPSPFFPVTAPTRRRENSGGLAQTVDTEAGTVPAPYTTCASAVHPCVSVCSGVPGLRAPL